YAMGWGVQDDETFAAIIQREIGRRVYNLAVSSYGTHRELLRLQRSGLLERVDIVIIQYCDNDLGENVAFQIHPPREMREKFEAIFHNRSSLVDRTMLIFKGIGLALGEPVRALRVLSNEQDFRPHYEELVKVIESVDGLRLKKIIVFYVNPWGRKFRNFPVGKDQKHLNVQFYEINFSEQDFFTIDGHLNKEGHYRVASNLKQLLADEIGTLLPDRPIRSANNMLQE
ncbi:MAG: SGNH/GDSL hydrolase family protein, partial [Thermosphaera sp.]